MTSPTARTLKALREDGWTAEVVEKWNPHTKTRHDFLGMADILACKPGDGILAVQATSGANHAARVNKLRSPIGPLENVLAWLKANGRLEVWSWRELKNRGRQKWFPRVTEFTCRRVGGGDVLEVAEHAQA